MGFFDTIHNEKIDFSKEYFISYLESEPPRVLAPGESITGKGGMAHITLIGFLELQTSSFSAQNPIHAKIEVYHTEFGEELDEDFWNALPHHFFAYFPKAKYAQDSDDLFEKEKAVVIKLEKDSTSQKITGEGDLIFPHEGEFDFIIFDPDNIPDFDELRTTLEFSYTVSSGKLIEKKSTYDNTISIKSADSFNSVLQSRHTWTLFFASLAIGVPSTIFAIRNHLIKPSNTESKS